MTSTIGNPLSWLTKGVAAAGRGLEYEVEHLGGDGKSAMPTIRAIGFADLRAALKAGIADFGAFRTDVIMACLLYPIIGGCLIWIAIHRAILPLAFPLVSGFALVGPVAAIGLYELSRRRERGQPAAWSDMFAVLKAPGFGAILLLGAGLMILFLGWLLVAWLTYAVTMGTQTPDSTLAFFRDVLTTPGGWLMIVIGIPLGFVFALVALSISIVSFPLMLDRDVGLPRAVVTSVRLTRQSPVTVLTWGGIVVAGLVLGALPLLLGLAVTLPILGHATWHLYRRAIV
jgi:uncharacterized membrane protein